LQLTVFNSMFLSFPNLPPCQPLIADKTLWMPLFLPVQPSFQLSNLTTLTILLGRTPGWRSIQLGLDAPLPPRGQARPLDNLNLVVQHVGHLDPEWVEDSVDASWVLPLLDPVHFLLELAVPEEEVFDQSKVKDE
jgi:hypothetical protein